MEKITNSSDEEKENIPIVNTARRSKAVPIRSRPWVPGPAPRKQLTLRYQIMKDKDDRRRKLLTGEDETSSDDSSIGIPPSLPNSPLTQPDEDDAQPSAYAEKPTQIPVCPTCAAKNNKQTKSVATQTLSYFPASSSDESMDEC